MEEVFTPSMNIAPSTSASLNRAEIREDLPAPVRPTIPTWKIIKKRIYAGWN